VTTRAQFRLDLRETLGSAALWPDATLDAWINQALRDFSASFPYEHTAVLTAVAGVQLYPLSVIESGGKPWEVYGVLRVEYPALAGAADPGEHPYLERRSRARSDFAGRPVYDLLDGGLLMLGETPLGGERIRVWYHGAHPPLTADNQVISAPDRCLDALRLYVAWQAAKEQELAYQTAPADPANFNLTQHGLNTQRAEAAYRARLAALLTASTAGGPAGAWAMPGGGRIY
jgi:hypothetical protein